MVIRQETKPLHTPPNNVRHYKMNKEKSISNKVLLIIYVMCLVVCMYGLNRAQNGKWWVLAWLLVRSYVNADYMGKQSVILEHVERTSRERKKKVKCWMNDFRAGIMSSI